MDGFLIGGCLFLLQKDNKANQYVGYFFVALILIVSGICFTGNASGITNPFISTIGFTLIAIMFAGLIYAAINNSSKLTSLIFNYGWLKFTGKISYGLYIFHWIILRVLELRIKEGFIQYLYFSDSTAQAFSLFICWL